MRSCSRARISTCCPTILTRSPPRCRRWQDHRLVQTADRSLSTVSPAGACPEGIDSRSSHQSKSFNAENNNIGFGQIEIFTKPGADKLRASSFFNFSDESLNSRNPFAPARVPFQVRYFGGSVSGPITRGKSSFSRRSATSN